MKKATALLIIFLLLNTSIVAIGGESSSPNKSILEKQIDRLHSLSITKHNNKIQNYKERLNNRFQSKVNNIVGDNIFSPEDIELKDDAFHGADTLHFTEWWYFDAVFDNGYTAQVGIRVLGVINQGIVSARLDIYKEGELESHELKKYLIWDFYASKDVPLIELKDKQVMDCHINETTGDWVYNLSLELDKSSVELCFVGRTKGWKGSTPGGKWAVILPRADVSGTIKLKNEEINVSGVGYHDHNWEITIFTGINFGWFWGKVNSNSYTMIWSKIMTTRFWGQPLLVINKKNNGYMNIESGDIQFIAKDIRIEKGMLVPYSFDLKVQKEDVYLKVDIEVIDTHHERWVGIINYWRYHIKCTGSITIDSQTEIIDDIQLAEYIRFRR
ncbi:MAG: hypothetical protein JSW06_10530 [Thermoplasmatales archaeon]|nr:MAG: hypothetical protein JSW06_10530 [Thermoplasmatales archaeon]